MNGRLVLALASVIAIVSGIVGYTLGSKEVGLRLPVFFKTSPNETTAGEEEKEPQPPFEFLYLDVARVGTYLAQLKNGAYVKENLSEKVTRKVNGEFTVVNALKAGASSEDENSVEREVTPTAASVFLKLMEELVAEKRIENGFLHRFGMHWAEASAKGGLDNKKVEEGEFVRFRAFLHVPAYLNPYLTVHHAATLAALFPIRRGERGQRKKAVEAQRAAARRFEGQVGRDPRFLLTLRSQQLPDGSEATYLMPVRLRQLNEERSLQGGSPFTVVGEVARVFPLPGSGGDTPPADRLHRPAYVDSLTRQLWRRPLAAAPSGLVCRSSPACASAIEESGVAGLARRRLARRVHGHIERDRRHMLWVLKRDTKIENAGAVILPIAIYR